MSSSYAMLRTYQNFVKEFLLSLDDLSQRPRLLLTDQELDFVLLLQILIPEVLEQHLVQPFYLVGVA